MSRAAELRALLKKGGPGIVPGAGDCFTARVLEDVGFSMLAISGSAAANAYLGAPDIGLITLDEIGEPGRAGSRMPVSIPVMADGDTGYGGVANVKRLVREMEDAGAAALHIEDQVFPKRCGHFEGKAVVPVEEMLLRLQAALDARRDPDFVIIARTDARQPEGFESAMRRAKAYVDLGVDGVFVEQPRSVEEMREIGSTFRGKVNLVNMVPGGKTPILPVDELKKRWDSTSSLTSTFRCAWERYAIKKGMSRLARGRETRPDPGRDAEFRGPAKGRRSRERRRVRTRPHRARPPHATRFRDVKKRRLGQLEVSQIGLGCAVMSGIYGAGPGESESIALIHRALDLGITFFDTADMYGSNMYDVGHNERLVGRALRDRRDRAVIATKFGQVRDPHDHTKGALDGRPEYVRQACDASLKRLGLDTIDIYYQHRVDPNVPIEETVGAMAGLVAAGKVRFIGLCAAKAETLRRAHKVHPLTAHEAEWSLWQRDPEETGTYSTCRELGIGFVPFSPLGRGFFSGNLRAGDIAANDIRFGRPRFSPENFDRNLWIAERLKEFAAGLNVTSSQLALAWVLARGDDVVPIPGTKRLEYLEQNVAATEIELTSEQLKAIEDLIPIESIAGAARPEWGTNTG